MNLGIDEGRLFGRDIDDVRSAEIDELALMLVETLRREWSISVNDLFANLRAQEQRLGEPLGEELERSLVEAWQWLRSEGLIGPSHKHWDREATTRAAENLPKDYLVSSRAGRLLRQARLDPELEAAAVPIFRRGQYDIAVLAAMRVVEIRVRRALDMSDTAELHGVDMVKQAFRIGGDLDDPYEAKAEREGRMALFWGAFAVYRNPAGHRYVNMDDPQEAAEAILFANGLLRIVDRAEAASEERDARR